MLQTEAEEAVLSKQRSKKTQKKYDERKKISKVEPALEDQFTTGRVLGTLRGSRCTALCSVGCPASIGFLLFFNQKWCRNLRYALPQKSSAASVI